MPELTEQQKERIVANKKRALELRQEKALLLKEKEAATKCEKCGSDKNIVQSYLETFQIPVCAQCGRKDDDYALINKTTAKEEYLLTDDMLNFMKYATKNNPMKTGWAPMKLYLTKLIREASMQRWGDEDSLKDEKERRALAKVLRDKEKMKDVAQNISSSVSAIASSAPSSGDLLGGGGFDVGGDAESGAIFGKMVQGIEYTMKEATSSSSSLSMSPTQLQKQQGSGSKKKAKPKMAFQTYNQAVLEQQDGAAMRLLANADSRGSGKNSNSNKRGAGAAAMVIPPATKKRAPKGGAGAAGSNPLAAMISSIRGGK
jgi:DNA repair protein